MKDRVSNDIGTRKQPVDWSTINWKTVKKRVRNLRQRIYRATQNSQWNRVRSLMKLMLRSYANLLLSIRQVTQINQGKKTAGIDGQTVLDSSQRAELVNVMRGYTLWQVKPVRRIYIPKANGKSRPLGIPTIQDRVAQAIVKNALEPVWETKFESHSYGFRPGRSCHDAIAQCHIRLRLGKRSPNNRWILDADVRGAFDNIKQQFIMDAIGCVPGRELIKQWLKAGYVEAKTFYSSRSGVPQGGVISPLLANIALDGMETLLSQYQQISKYSVLSDGVCKKSQHKSAKYGFIRYCDDFIITAKTRKEIEDIQPVIVKWLQERGLELNTEKTNIVPVEQGFNFLGFHIRQFQDGCFTLPQKQKVLAFLQRIRQWLKTHYTVKTEAVIHYLNPILRGWGNYYRHGASKKTFSYVDDQIWKMLWQWSLRRHPNKSKRWVVKKYFFLRPEDGWRFQTFAYDRKGNKQMVALFSLATIPIERHTKVKGKSSPDDPTLQSYWQQRQTRYGKIYWAKGSKFYKIAQNQQWKCPVCGDHLFNNEALNTHHLIPVKSGGTNSIENLIHLHEHCHKQIHRAGCSGLRKA